MTEGGELHTTLSVFLRFLESFISCFGTQLELFLFSLSKYSQLFLFYLFSSNSFLIGFLTSLIIGEKCISRLFKVIMYQHDELAKMTDAGICLFNKVADSVRLKLHLG